MTFNERLESFKQDMYKYISTKKISLLKDLDKRISINKSGKYSYFHNCESKYEFCNELHSNIMFKFLHDLDDKKIYILIPFISANNRPDQPYIILSQQILVTNHSNYSLLTKYINDKINETINLYKLYDLEEFHVTFKYKQIEFNF
jgi:hypothetical protein